MHLFFIFSLFFFLSIVYLYIFLNSLFHFSASTIVFFFAMIYALDVMMHLAQTHSLAGNAFHAKYFLCI